MLGLVSQDLVINTLFQSVFFVVNYLSFLSEIISEFFTQPSKVGIIALVVGIGMLLKPMCQCILPCESLF